MLECRCLGSWPSQSTSGVWNGLLWRAATRPELDGKGNPLPFRGDPACLPRVGCDVAISGDWTAIHARWGRYSIHHERHSGWELSRTAGRLKQVAAEMAARHNATCPPQRKQTRPEEIPILIDRDGIGRGLLDPEFKGDYLFIGISAAAPARLGDDYPNRRSELWFNTTRLARQGQLNLSYLPAGTLEILRIQCMAPTWTIDSGGRLLVERKVDTKKRLQMSPDDADSMNLAYTDAGLWECPSSAPAPERDPDSVPKSRYTIGERREGPKLFGRGR